MIYEHNVLVAGKSFLESCAQLAAFQKVGYKPNVRPGKRDGEYLVAQAGAPEVDETVFFYGIFASGIYGFCSCPVCQNNKIVCLHMAAAAVNFAIDRSALPCVKCGMIRPPEALDENCLCVVCMLEAKKKPPAKPVVKNKKPQRKTRFS